MRTDPRQGHFLFRHVERTLRAPCSPSVKHAPRCSTGFGNEFYLAASLPLLLLLALFGSTAKANGQKPTSETGSAEIDFNRDIRPLLGQYCLNCHGPDESSREADLRLDIRDKAIEELPSGLHAIVPNDSEASELVYRLFTDDESLRMPPFDSGSELSEDERQLLKTWIEQGAPYAEHWAFVPPQKVEPPSSDIPEMNVSVIDRFITQRLNQHGLAMEPVAQREVLLRRIALDVTGLPPTWEEIQQYVNDDSPDATEKMIDRYLDSSAFGERWAATWLDLARYADSQGYAQDPLRNIWRYRDWVIQSYNKNQPFDQFTIEQIAGDLLPEPSKEQILATAFHRNTMTNSEGGTDDEEFRSAAIIDRVNTTMQVWMGVTMGCAQCHTHKYDPITQTEYFQVYDIFNQTADSDHPSDRPHLSEYSQSRSIKREQLAAKIAVLEAKVAEQVQDSNEELQLPESGELQTRYVRVELLKPDAVLHLAEVEVFQDEINVARNGNASQISTSYDAPAANAIDGNRDGHFFDAKSTTHTAQTNNPWWEVDLLEAKPIDKIVLWNRTDSPGVRDRLDNYRVILLDEQHHPIWSSHRTKPPQPNVELLPVQRFDEFSADQRAEIVQLRKELAIGTTELDQLRAELAKLNPDIQTPIMEQLPLDQYRQTHIHIRGNFRQPGERVEAGVPAVFHAPKPEAELNRLAFAEWLVDRNNPLTARVIVNRYWEELFGAGLVKTSEDFGTQGELPTHPELLDWLAVDFMEHGWDRKRLIKLMLTSRTYQQSSRVSPEKLKADPFNELHSRGPRFRLSAEMVRDQALAVSGLLSNKMLGPSVQPPRPQLGLKAAFGGSTDWETSSGEDRYRRGLYTQIRRTTPYPSFMTFDASSREVCTIRRIRTNTPLQALVTLNDPVYVEAAQGLARRVLTEPDVTGRLKQVNASPTSDDVDRLRCEYAFRLALVRAPQDDELQVLLSVLNDARARFEQQPNEAMKFATQPIGPIPEGIEVDEAAAWTLVANVLFNLDETLARP